MITVNGPNGIVINFPDGTPTETIDNAMRQASLGTPQQEAQGAREAAAMRMQESVRPPGGRAPDLLPKMLAGGAAAVGHVGGGLAELGRQARESSMRLAEGDPEASIKPVLDMATMGLGVSPGIKASMMPRPFTRDQLAEAQTGVASIPRAAEAGPVGSAIAARFGKTPETAAAATSELQGAAARVAARPAGETIGADEAGSVLRDAISKAGDNIHPRLGILASDKRSNEGVVDTLFGMARTGSSDDVAALAQLRRIVPAEQQGKVQSAFIQRLGRAPGSEEFNPTAFVENYGGLSDRTKNILFGGASPNSLRQHLDSIENISQRAPTWQRFETPVPVSGGALTVGAMGVGAAALGPVAGPIAGLAAVIPLKLIGDSLAKPAGAASIAAWSRAYERVMRTNAAPQALAVFNIATRNLNNTLDVNINPNDFLGRP